MHEMLEPNQLHVAVDLLILTVREGKMGLLLSKRTEMPYCSCWALPGRMVEAGQSAEASAETLLAEMLPVQNSYMEQLYTFSAVDRDPRGRVISIAYLVIVPWQQLAGILPLPQVSLRYFILSHASGSLCIASPEEGCLKEGDLAFDHGQMIRTGLERLRGKIGYSELGFRFLSNCDAFSLGEMQTIFEAILGEGLDSSNFRRSILGRYETTGRIRLTEGERKKGRGRPAALYCYRP